LPLQPVEIRTRQDVRERINLPHGGCIFPHSR
jgi:hypothetical protein